MDTVGDLERSLSIDVGVRLPRQFEELASFIESGPSNRLGVGTKVCFVTNEMVAFHNNGGLGTATTGLIETFIERGFEVSIIYTAVLQLQSEDVQNAIGRLRATGVDFTCLQELIPASWMTSPRKLSYACYWLLCRRNYTIVHFNDYLGNGFYAAQARYTGTELCDTVIITTVHGPTKWALNIDERPMASLEQQEICFLETRALELSDAVIGVSHHLLEWLRNEGVNLPRHSYVHKNIMPTGGEVGQAIKLQPGQLSEVVFFARQDVRKGFVTMLDAIKRLASTLPYLKYTFLGKFSTIAGEHSGAIALDELRNVPNLIDFRHNLDRTGALRHLRRPGVLAVIPSVDENSPCTVFECIAEGIPFIASKVGGIPELVAAADWSSVFFEPNSAGLAAKIQDVADNGLDDVALAFYPTAVAVQMVQGFGALQAQIESEWRNRRLAVAEEAVLVSVVVTHFNRPAMLKQLLSVLEQQTYQNFEVIVIDDGSTKTDAISYIASLRGATYRYPLRVYRTKNRYLGAARNAGVRRAQGVYIKFQDDDNLPMPHEIEYFVRAALTTDADLVTGMSRFFREEAELKEELDFSKLEYFPLGASLPLSLTRNEYGDANALVRREAFLADGGFTEIYGVGSEDYEFFLKFESLGRKIVFVPKPLFNYRVAGNSMLQSTSVYSGAKRARSGLRVRNQRWLKELIDAAHEGQLARDIKDQAWWRAGNRRFGDLHREMMQGDPASHDNISRFLDMAARYGRLEDVIHIVLGQNTLIDSLKWLERNTKTFDESLTGVRQFLRCRPRIFKFESFPVIELVQPTENLPTNWAVYRVENTGMLVHPLAGRVTQVLVSRAIPSGAKKVTLKFSHRNAGGGPVRMAFDIYLQGASLAASGWVDLTPGGLAQASITLNAPVTDTADLMIMSTIDGRQDFAWAFADHFCVELAA